MSNKFSLSSSIVLRAEPQYYNTYVAFDYRMVRTEFLSEIEFKTLEYIRYKAADIDEIFKHTGMKDKDCKKFLKRMIKIKYVQSNSEKSETTPFRKIEYDSKLYEKFPIPFLSAPSTVDIFITSKCNLECVHCFSRKDNVERSLSLDELKSIFDQLEDVGVFEVRINGGETFLHPNIDEIITILKEKRFRKVILTNGTLLDDKKVESLKDSNIIPTVSLDGSSGDEHDRFRGCSGSFKQTIEGLKLLKKHQVLYGINCCLHKNNLTRIDEIVKLAIQFGASRIAFLDLKITDRLRTHRNWIPTYEEYQSVMFSLLSAKIKYRRKIDVALDVFLRCQPLQESLEEAKKGFVSCQAGRNRLSIDADGSVYPCNLVISDKKWEIGNIKKQKISDIWFSEKWMFFRGELTKIKLKKCIECKDLKKCKDFYCRLLPYITNGDPLAPHPRCS
ncbi:radical SAM protein [[Eubacterium] cellulosolvens]